MDLQHIAFKILVDGELSVEWEQFIHVFHDWVAKQSMPEMVIDVADYRHVPNGPGVVMVGHEADYYMDNTQGKPGLRYVCKVAKDTDAAGQISEAFSRASAACARLESEIPGLQFSRTEFELTINDRAIAPNNDATRSALEAELPSILAQVLAASSLIELETDPRKLAGCRITTATPVEL